MQLDQPSRQTKSSMGGLKVDTPVYYISARNYEKGTRLDKCSDTELRGHRDGEKGPDLIDLLRP